MEETVYGYVRVSAQEQNEARQLTAMREFGVPEENIVIEKQSGKDFQRPRYKKLIRGLRAGDVRMVTEQGRPSREVAAELGICIDTLRNWLKSADLPSPGQADRQNWDAKRLCELEAENCALRKRIEEKDERTESLLRTQARLQSYDQLKTRSSHHAQSPCAPLLL